ncbi:MAG: hypothetical protein HWN67_08790 [Candidatus Helarchaeota archaeon]|nr:hypothetical protein [Candidatus Helarchaeota archaeon]
MGEYTLGERNTMGEWITYLAMIPKSIAEDWGVLADIGKTKVSVNDNLDNLDFKNFKLLFHIQAENLQKVKFGFYTIDDDKYEDPRAYIITNFIDLNEYEYHETVHWKIVLDNYFMVREVLRKKSCYIYTEAWEDYRFWDLKRIVQKLDNLKEEKKRINSRKYYLILNTIGWDAIGWEIDNPENKENNISYDSCKEILINPNILLPEIEILYLEGFYDGVPLWEKPYLKTKGYQWSAENTTPNRMYWDWP